MTDPIELLDNEIDAPKVKVTKDVVSALSKHIPDLDDAQINSVLEALNKVREGAAIGTVMRDDTTGFVAHRVDEDGIVLWKVTGPDGTQYNDMQSTLPWTQIYPLQEQ